MEDFRLFTFAGMGHMIDKNLCATAKPASARTVRAIAGCDGFYFATL